MKNKKIFFLGLISIFLFGCSGNGGVTFTDRKGNKYTFKEENITCQQTLGIGSISCEGSAIKENIAGQRYAIDFESRFCSSGSTKGDFISPYHKPRIYKDLICSAAKELGKLHI